MTQTDLTVSDVIPLTLPRGYNPADSNSRAFGNNSDDLYDTFLTHDQQEPVLYTEADLNLIDGARVHFGRITPGTRFTTAVMRAQSTSPQFSGATLAWNGAGWNLALRDGLTLVYGVNAPLQALRDSHGNTVRIFRLYQNTEGNYVGPISEVVSPNGYWLAYTWDTSRNHDFYVLAAGTAILVHNHDCSDLAWQAALHIQEGIDRGEISHVSPGIDMSDTEAIAAYLDRIMEGPSHTLGDGERAWYDANSGVVVVARTQYSATAYQMTYRDFLKFLSRRGQ